MARQDRAVPPPVTVSGGAAARPRPVRTPRRGLRVTVGLLVLAVLVGVALHAHLRDRRAHRLAAELAGAQLVAGTAVSGGVPGVRGSQVQEAVVLLSVRSTGPDPLVLLAAELDGAPPSVTQTGRVGRGEQAQLVLRWRVRCAEVGQLPGPRAVGVQVALPSGRRTTLTVPLPARGRAGSPAEVFHDAAVEVCAVLLP